MENSQPGQDIFAQQLSTKTQKKRGRFWRWLGLFSLICGLGAAGYFTMTKSGRETKDLIVNVAGVAYETRQNPDIIFQDAGSDIVNILLIGRDVNWKIGKVYDPKTKSYRPYQVHDETASARSDTMIVVSLDKARKTIRMMSFPRDALVRIPEHGRERLNAAHAYGGPELLIRTFHDELGLTIHHYAVIKFDGFKKLIDQLGGINVNVEGALKKDRRGKLYRGNLKYDDNWGNLHINLQPGPQWLSGEQAHGYVRFRMDREGDPGRIRRQQSVMRALAKQMAKAPVWQLPGLIKEVRQQFKSTLSDPEIASAAYFARGLGDPSKIQPLTLFAAMNDDGGTLTLNRPKNEKLLSYIFGPTFNHDRFLVRSPETRRDDIGPTNNASPQAIAVLREAGVLEKGEAGDRSNVLDVPERVEPLPAQRQRGEANPRAISARSQPRAERRVRLADAEAVTRSTEASPRRHRRVRRERVERRTAERRETRTASPAEAAPAQRESPIPVPEAE